MNVSFVVIGLNEGDLLRRCFASVCQAISESKYLSGYELLYVDSGSVDGSIHLAKSFSYRVLMLTADRSAAAARRVGQIQAKNDFVIFLDGDMELDSSFIDSAFSCGFLEDIDNFGITGKRSENLVNDDASEVLVSDDFYGSQGRGVLLHLGGAVLLRGECRELEVLYDESQILWEESLLLYSLLSKGKKIIGINAPFITHNNKKKSSLIDVLRSYLSPSGTGYYFARLCYETLKRGGGWSLLKCQLSFLVTFFLVVSSLLNFLLFGHSLYFLFVAGYLISQPKKTVHYAFRSFWLVLYPFMSKRKFVLEWVEV